MTRTVNVTVRGVVLTVTGDYEREVPAKTNAEPDECYPAEGGTFEITAVDCGGQDITELVDYRMDEIAEAAAEVAALDEGEAEDEE
jgi:hypothetical protein